MLGYLFGAIPWINLVLIVLLCIVLYILVSGPYVSKPLTNSAASSALRDKILEFKYLFAGASIIDEAYVKANGGSFRIQTPKKQHTMVTSQRHLKELNDAPLNVLSLHAVAKDFLRPKHTMHGFEWKDQRGIEGVGFVRALRSLLTSHLPAVLPNVSSAIAEEFQTALNAEKVLNDSYRRLPIFDVAKKLVTRVNCVVFFGAELSKNPGFVKVALEFPEEVFLAAEIIRMLPSCVAPLIANLVTKGHRSSRRMQSFLLPIVERRLALRDSENLEERFKIPSDGIQWLVDTSPRKEPWSPHRLVGEIMAIWYGSVHTLAIAATYAIIDLYARPDCITPLREEADGQTLLDFRKSAEGLPLLDSFLKESARLSAFESTGVRRQALSPFSFSDGLRISTGDWVCVPHRSMMRDAKHFERPLEFDAFRFVSNPPDERHNSSQRTRAVDASAKWLVWGYGRILCPGRFYAIMVMKLILIHLIQNYDCRLEDYRGSRSMQWRSAVIPKASIGLLIRPRERQKTLFSE